MPLRPPAPVRWVALVGVSLIGHFNCVVNEDDGRGGGGGYSQSQKDLADTLDGDPPEDVQALAAALEAGLSAEELDYLTRLEWAGISADAFKSDPILRKAVAIVVTAQGEGSAKWVASAKAESGGSCSQGDECYTDANAECEKVFTKAGKDFTCLAAGNPYGSAACLGAVLGVLVDQIGSCLAGGGHQVSENPSTLAIPSTPPPRTLTPQTSSLSKTWRNGAKRVAMARMHTPIRTHGRRQTRRRTTVLVSQARLRRRAPAPAASQRTPA